MEVNMGYCYVCQSAGSVTKYGFCEICRTEHQTETTIRTPELSEVIEPRSVYEFSRAGRETAERRE
jgi:hypothetical protein